MKRQRGHRVRDPKRRIIRVRLNEQLYQRLKEISSKTGRTQSEILRAALRAWLKEEQE